MERRPCGKSGLKLSELGAGCWAYGGGSYWGEQNQADVDAATQAALASAKGNNPALGPLDVLGVKIVDSWARVDLQPTNKSTDAASWFLKKTNGAWTVVDFGTSVQPSDHPDAPAAIFQ